MSEEIALVLLGAALSISGIISLVFAPIMAGLFVSSDSSTPAAQMQNAMNEAVQNAQTFSLILLWLGLMFGFAGVGGLRAGVFLSSLICYLISMIAIHNGAMAWISGIVLGIAVIISFLDG
jgi:uncharacterized membrane protein